MAGVYEPKITNCCVANFGNSLAITCDLRLALGDFESHIRSSRINQRFLNIAAGMPHLPHNFLRVSGTAADELKGLLNET